MDTNLRNQIKNLSVSERILLAEEIWDSAAEENKSFVLSSTKKKNWREDLSHLIKIQMLEGTGKKLDQSF